MTDKTWNAIQTRWSNLRQSIGTASIDALLDAFLLIYDESSQLTSTDDKAIRDFQDYGARDARLSSLFTALLLPARPFVSQVKQSRVNRNDFELVKIISRGAFGEGQFRLCRLERRDSFLVSVVKLKSTEQTFAMKTVKKSDLLSRVDTASFREERDVLLQSDSPWITKLHFTFQDHEHLVKHLFLDVQSLISS